MKFFYSLVKHKAFTYLIVLLFPATAFCQTNRYTGASGGTWNTNGNWSLGTVPTAAHDVLINSNVTINVNTNPIINSLTVDNNVTATLTAAATQTITIDNNGSTVASGSTLNLTGTTGGGTRVLTVTFSGAGRTMAIAGSLNVNIADNDPGHYNATNSATTVTGTITNNGGTVTSTAANLSFSAGGTYVHALNGSVIPAATWNAASNCNIRGITGTAPTGLGQSFGNFSWDCIGQTTGFLFAGALTTINGNFTIANTNLFGLYLASTNGSTYTLNIGGNLTINNNAWLSFLYGQNNNLFGDNITGTINVGGNFSMTAADSYFDYLPFIATGGGLSLAKLTLNVAGNFSQSGGGFDFAAGNSDATNFTELRLAGNFSLTGTGVMQTSTGDAQITNGTIFFTKTGVQTVQATTPANLIYTNFVVNSGSTTQLLSNIQLSSIATPVWAGNFTVNSGGILDAGTFTIESSTGATAGVNNSFTLSSGAGLITANTSGVQNTTLGTVSTSLANRTFSSAANYTYNGTATQNSGTFVTTPTANQVNNLTLNNTAGAATTGVTLQQPLSVAGILTLTSGHITTTSNLLTMNAGSGVQGAAYAPPARQSGGSSTSFVNGPMRKIGNTNFLFPIGKIGSGYHYCGISAPANVAHAFTAEYMRGSASQMGPVTAPGLNHVSFCEYWDIQRTTGASTVDVVLSWNGTSNCNAAVYVNDLATLRAAHFASGSWNSFGGATDVGSTVAAGSVNWIGVTTFSPFSLGSTSAVFNPLPVKLVNVKAYGTGDRNKIEWTNLTETEVSSYEIERSTNGTDFITMASIAARSNNTGREDYMAFDLQPSAVTYYRIKVKGTDAGIVYSPIVKVSSKHDQQSGLTLYPNPVSGKQFSLLMNMPAGDYTIRVFSANGQVVKTENLKHPGGSYSKTIELPGQLQAGQYMLQVSGENILRNTKFILQ